MRLETDYLVLGWAGLEIDGLGGSTPATTSNFYLFLSWGFIEIVKCLGAKNVLTESFHRVFFWNHVLSLVGRGWAAAWLGLGW